MWKNTIHPDRSKMKICGAEKRRFECQIFKKEYGPTFIILVLTEFPG